MCELLGAERPSPEQYDIEDSILSFNYTRAVRRFQAGRHGELHDIDYVNIHGNIYGEIIFGIDGTNCLNSPSALPFTKNYRLMAHDLPDPTTIVQPHSLGSEGTGLIKFYGHSLGDADYSYFQALFDTVKLYENSTRLIFYYRAHGNTSPEVAREDMMRKVVRLLNTYGTTLDNKDHGKNLIHKLLLEGRLSVRELPDTYRRV
ncbi:AbiH family protein [Paratractidigestivibacter faecalis]|uniref:AbiH family protein n=1 Tax=Paratractidigestivibacter faecalis TaxID=2292441 RepID=UPI003F9BEFC7